jgi:hypothetical protein
MAWPASGPATPSMTTSIPLPPVSRATPSESDSCDRSMTLSKPSARARSALSERPASRVTTSRSARPRPAALHPRTQSSPRSPTMMFSDRNTVCTNTSPVAAVVLSGIPSKCLPADSKVRGSIPPPPSRRCQSKPGTLPVTRTPACSSCHSGGGVRLQQPRHPVTQARSPGRPDRPWRPPRVQAQVVARDAHGPGRAHGYHLTVLPGCRTSLVHARVKARKSRGQRMHAYATDGDATIYSWFRGIPT